MASASTRVSSIDIFRAITMVLMIFVNDLWTLSGIPAWLEHADTYQDFLGLSDVVFPAFLFVMGMSIPFAIRNRLAKGESNLQVMKHIVMRSAALLVMGLFTVNLGSVNVNATGIREEWFEIIMVIGFFLVWNVYPKTEGRKKFVFQGLQILGIIVLAWLAIVYRSGGQHGQALSWMKIKWWGILGLIGWAYFGSAIIYLFARNKPVFLALAWFLFTLLTIAGHAGWLHQAWPHGPQDWIPGNGAFHSFTMAGIIAVLILEKYAKPEKIRNFLLSMLVISILMFISGIISRHFFIVSKNLATPTWIFFCLAISFAFYGFIHWLVNGIGKASWFDIIKPAGTATLTCYLVPYVYYSVRDLYMLVLPNSWKIGAVGLFKSLIYTFIIIGITALLVRMKIKLKI